MIFKDSLLISQANPWIRTSALCLIPSEGFCLFLLREGIINSTFLLVFISIRDCLTAQA